MPLKSKRVASSLRAWLRALSISCFSISETMSKEGICAISNLSLRIYLDDFDVPLRRANFDIGPGVRADECVDLRDRATSLFLIGKIAGNFAVEGFRDQMK